MPNERSYRSHLMHPSHPPDPLLMNHVGHEET